jgi:tetratricopeptide (TPR) repeat protein
MDAKPLVTKALALEPIEVSGGDSTRTAGGESANAKTKRDLRITTPDEFLAAAAKEYQEGRIDRALWSRAADQSNDASLVVAAYLRARAAVLQLQQKKAERLQSLAHGADSIAHASERKVDSESSLEVVLTKVAGLPFRGANAKLMYVGAAAVALVFIVAIALLVVSPRKSESIAQPIVSAAAPSPNQPTPPAHLASEQPLVKTTSDDTNQGSPETTLETRVQQLKNDGKWNVLVPYASEWTRKEPNNAAAWNELSVGYTKLRQFNDALDAATRAVQLSPENSLFLRNLGYINLAMERLPEARIAFDRALAASSDDAGTLCGAALVAQRQGRPNEATAIAERAASAGGICPRVSDGASVAVVAAGSAAPKSVGSVGR